MVPYPAEITQTDSHVVIKVLDFEDFTILGRSRDEAISLAQDRLLRRLMTSLRDSTAIPQPDQYLEIVNEQRVVMVDPLAAAV